MRADSNPDPTFILPLRSDEARFSNAGGKGANLSRLARAGLPVPDGFVVTTAAYRAFVGAHDLVSLIRTALDSRDLNSIPQCELASRLIRPRFDAGTMPAGLARALLDAFAGLGRLAVAVRSSATAEDLPELSFAGQQDTFLKVVDDDALMHAVLRCWGSLWTARAISYRSRNHIEQTSLALAVVVQRMVGSRASGVLFTANPVTGLRTETVIDATLALGESLVSGRVAPDHSEAGCEHQAPLQGIASSIVSTAALVLFALGMGWIENVIMHEARPKVAVDRVA